MSLGTLCAFPDPYQKPVVECLTQCSHRVTCQRLDRDSPNSLSKSQKGLVPLNLPSDYLTPELGRALTQSF